GLRRTISFDQSSSLAIRVRAPLRVRGSPAVTPAIVISAAGRHSPEGRADACRRARVERGGFPERTPGVAFAGSVAAGRGEDAAPCNHPRSRSVIASYTALAGSRRARGGPGTQ